MAIIDLLPEEEKYFKNKERCEACNHLDVLHNYHCCEYCMIEDCPCKWMEIKEDD